MACANFAYSFLSSDSRGQLLRCWLFNPRAFAILKSIHDENRSSLVHKQSWCDHQTDLNFTGRLNPIADHHGRMGPAGNSDADRSSDLVQVHFWACPD